MYQAIKKYADGPIIKQVSNKLVAGQKFDVYVCHMNGFNSSAGELLGYDAPWKFFGGQFLGW